jgi:hypothetical protein
MCRLHFIINRSVCGFCTLCGQFQYYVSILKVILKVHNAWCTLRCKGARHGKLIILSGLSAFSGQRSRTAPFSQTVCTFFLNGLRPALLFPKLRSFISATWCARSPLHTSPCLLLYEPPDKTDINALTYSLKSAKKSQRRYCSLSYKT